MTFDYTPDTPDIYDQHRRLIESLEDELDFEAREELFRRQGPASLTPASLERCRNCGAYFSGLYCRLCGGVLAAWATEPISSMP